MNATFSLVKQFIVLVLVRISVNIFLNILMFLALKKAANAENEGHETSKILIKLRHEEIDDKTDEEVKFIFDI